VNALTSSGWFHDVVVPNAQVLCFPDGKTKFVLPDGTVGKQPGNAVVLLGAGDTANAALLRSGLGACMRLDPGARDGVTTQGPPLSPFVD
jgi:hypothetical protein